MKAPYVTPRRHVSCDIGHLTAARHSKGNTISFPFDCRGVTYGVCALSRSFECKQLAGRSALNASLPLLILSFRLDRFAAPFPPQRRPRERRRQLLRGRDAATRGARITIGRPLPLAGPAFTATAKKAESQKGAEKAGF
ncbi:hypothetical protein MTO96_048545 [Rhipicephalus appendiculatus]